MAIWDYPMAAAQLAVSSGVDVNHAYDVMQSLGATVDRESFGRLYGQAQLAADMVAPSANLSVDQLPGSEYIQARSTVTSSGYQYQLSVSATDKESGADFQIPYSIRTDTLITPGEAIDAAIISQTLRAEEYNLDINDAMLTGIYELTPSG